MTNVGSICPAASLGETGRDHEQANRAEAHRTQAEPRLTDARTHSIALADDRAELAAMLPHWEVFLKGRFPRNTEIPT
jgi:hypothetical protein